MYVFTQVFLLHRSQFKPSQKINTDPIQLAIHYGNPLVWLDNNFK